MTDAIAKYLVWLFMSVMLVCLIGAIPMALYTGNKLYYLGLLAMIFFAT